MSKLSKGWFHRLYDRLTHSTGAYEGRRTKHLHAELTSVEVDQMFLQMGHMQRVLEAICEEVKKQHTDVHATRKAVDAVFSAIHRIERDFDANYNRGGDK